MNALLPVISSSFSQIWLFLANQAALPSLQLAAIKFYIVKMKKVAIITGQFGVCFYEMRGRTVVKVSLVFMQLLDWIYCLKHS